DLTINNNVQNEAKNIFVFLNNLSNNQNVDDENDNPPVLEQHHYIFDISEGLPRHSLIGQIKSTDADRDKENRYITYELRDVVNINASNFIYVEQNTGIIYSRKILDREEIQQIPLIIIARNEKPKSKFSSIHLNRTIFYDEASVTINIIDQNDNAPIMLHHGEILKYNGGAEGGLHIQTKQLQQLSVVDLKYNINVKDPFNSCIEFPYYFADADEKENAQIDVTLETNPYFEFRLDHTIICKISKEDPPLGQYTVHVIARDRPTDPTKSLKRRYAVRIHIVNEQVSTIESQTNLLKNIDFDSPPVSRDTHSTKWLQPVRLNGKDKKDLDFEKRYPKTVSSTNNAYQSYQSTNILDESQQRYGLSTIAIVVALISVAGLLCLLLIGVVIAMKRIVPRTHNEIPMIICTELIDFVYKLAYVSLFKYETDKPRGDEPVILCIPKTEKNCIIMEQLNEWNSSLYINFTDSEEAFDSVDRTTLWKLLRNYGVPQKIFSIIQNSCDGLN
ncbi:unnamed protein product, partial [Schistosoma margrebowiei]